ncbi:MAG: type II secretion system protein GspE [Ruminococcaceae bacterium]|jgi:type IV pilus assembly protein PilB|nr:type II secretion system protein GspE [Oscillospiraceae bacterium]
MGKNIVFPGSVCGRLLRAGVINEDQLNEALEIQKTNRALIGNILVELGYCTEEDIARVLAEKTNTRFVSINEIGVNMSVAGLITPEMAMRNNVLPLYEEEGTLYVVMKNPNDIITIDDLKRITGYDIKPLVATDTELSAAIENFVNMSSNVNQFDEEEELEDTLTDEEFSLDDKPAVQLINQIINNSVRAGASDVHIEALERNMRVRFRIDGVLQEVMTNPLKIYNSAVSRVKVIGGMDIAEKRIPQDGRATVRFDDRTFDLRIATLPTVYGEKVVMRLLERRSESLHLKDIKFSPRQVDRFIDAIHKPYGFILVTGPTGSGKSTTLYATLADISTNEKNTITLEDPVERRMPGINQVQMNNRAGMTFAAGLRSILRSDPDIVMVGEIRDAETAKIAIEAALTGHMVLSTLHTNDAPTAITRLDEMGVEPFLTASSLVGVLAQRLVRKLCKSCKEPYTLTKEELKNILPDYPFENFPDKNEFTFYEPKGCLSCNNTGYKGREAVFEFLTVTEEMRQLILRRANGPEIKELAQKQGMLTLRQDAIYKITEGSTSIEEMLRVIV